MIFGVINFVGFLYKFSQTKIFLLKITLEVDLFEDGGSIMAGFHL